jgi:excisionase family DNA binding protein
MTTHAAETDGPPGPRYYKPAQVADRLNIGLRTVYELIASGALESVRIGTGRGTLRVAAAVLDAYEARLRADANAV